MLSGQWSGWVEAQKAIAGLGEIAGHEVQVATMKKLGQPIAEDMAAGCPRMTGLTADDFGVAESKESKAGGAVEVLVGAHSGKGGRAFIAGFIERGTVKRGAHPFMRPAADRAIPRLPGEYLKLMRQAYLRVVRKYASRVAA